MRAEVVDSVRRECLRAAATVLVDAGASDELRQACIGRCAELVDALLRGLAVQSMEMNSRETLAAAQAIFVMGWPIVLCEWLPLLVVSLGGDERTARAVRSSIENQAVVA